MSLTPEERAQALIGDEETAARKRCWLWHRWGPWTDPARVRVEYFRDGVKVGEGCERRQEHRCEACGIVKFRQVTR